MNGRPSGLQGELIVYTCPVVCQSFLKIFSSVITWPFKTKFHMEPLWERRMIVCINGPDHIAKLVAMPING